MSKMLNINLGNSFLSKLCLKCYIYIVKSKVNKIGFCMCRGGRQKNGKFGEGKWQIWRILAKICHNQPKIGQNKPKYV